MTKVTKIAPEDWGFVPVDPSPNFDPEHNRRVIEETIRENELNRKRNLLLWTKKAREKAAAVAKYLKSLDAGETNGSVLDYFGRHELARLRGEEIRNTLMGRLSDAKKKEARKIAKLSSVKP